MTEERKEEQIQEKQEETKKEPEELKEEKEEKKEVFKTALKIVLGLILIGVGIWAVIGWWQALWTVFKGCIGLFLILAGAITIAIARE